MTGTTVSTPPVETPELPAARPRSSRARWLAPVASVAAGTALIALHGSLYGNWIVDDAAITFAYARNVADGAGSVLQPGAEPTEGYSNPAWMALLVVGRLLGLFDRGAVFGIPDYVLFPKALAVLCCAGVLAGCYTAARKVVRRPWLVTVAFGAVLAAIPSFVIWVFSGLENPLYALVTFWLAVVLFVAVVDDRLLSPKVAAAAGALAALAALTRPDGLVYAAAYPLLVLITLRRAGLAAAVRAVALSVAVFLAPVGAYVTWRRVEFGQWLALPALAKNQAPPELAQFTRVGELVQYAGALTVLVAAVFVGMVSARRSRLGSGLAAVLVPLALALLGYAVLAGDWMEQFRFATPVWALGAFAAVLAVARVLSRTTARRRAVLSVVLVAALLPTTARFTAAAEGFRTEPTVPMCVIAETYGRGFNGYADILGADRATLLLPDVGGTALASRLSVVDLAGLTEPRFAALWGAGDMRGIRDYVFDELKPTFIHTHGYWSAATGLASDRRLRNDYVVISSGTQDEDWVRRDAVPDRSLITRMREYSRTDLAAAWRAQANAPRGRCGANLQPGQVVPE